MYEEFYRLHTNPFRITPDPKFCFCHSGYQTARQYLDYALRLGEGFIMVTGRPGTGKTTLAETFLKDVDLGRVTASRIAASGLEGHDMLRAVAYSYGIDANALDKATLRRRIQQHLLQQKQSGRRALLIIDEAQGLPPSSLEELRLLADLQQESQPLLQLFLVGQEQLREVMCTPQMEQFQQRIIATCHLKPLGLRETRAYIKHRLTLSGWKGDPELSGAALLTIHAWSGGVPRQINKICNRTLLLGYGKGKHVLDETDARTIAAELREEQLTYEGEGPETANDPGPPRTPESGAKGTLSASELAVKWDEEDGKNPIRVAAAAPVSAPQQVPAATRRAQQTSVWRMEANARNRREKLQQVKTSTPRQNRAPVRGTRLPRDKVGPVRPSAARNWPRTALALTVTALATASLLAVGSAKFHLQERTGPKNSPREHRATTDPSTSLPLERQQNTADARSQGGGSRINPPHLSASPDGMQTDENRASGNGNSIVVAATQAPATDKVPNMAVADPTPSSVRPERSAELVPNGGRDASATTADGSDRDDVTITASNAYTSRPELTDPSPAGDRQGKTVSAPVDPGRSAVSPNTTAAQSNPASTDFAMLDPPAAGAPSDTTDAASVRPAAPQRLPEAKIAALLALGKEALQKFRLLTPDGDSAYYYFRQVLMLDPGNAEARKGLDKIAERYIALVRRANAQQKTDLAKVYISRGLRVQPANRELLALQERRRKPAATPIATIASAEPDIVSEPQQATSLLSRLRSLFTWHRTQPADVAEHSISATEP